MRASRLALEDVYYLAFSFSLIKKTEININEKSILRNLNNSKNIYFNLFELLGIEFEKNIFAIILKFSLLF